MVDAGQDLVAITTEVAEKLASNGHVNSALTLVQSLPDNEQGNEVVLNVRPYTTK